MRILFIRGNEVLLETAAASIIDRLIQLVKAHDEDKRKLFTDHIEPLFLDFAQHRSVQPLPAVNSIF